MADPSPTTATSTTSTTTSAAAAAAEGAITGTCLCGSLTLTIPPGVKAIKSMSCYCVHCQKNAGGPLQTNAMFPTSAITITDADNTLKIYMISGDTTSSGLPKGKGFCGRCGCNLFTRPGHYNGEMTVVKTGILDNGAAALFPPLVELYTRARPDYCKPVEGAKQFETMPGH